MRSQVMFDRREQAWGFITGRLNDPTMQAGKGSPSKVLIFCSNVEPP